MAYRTTRAIIKDRQIDSVVSVLLNCTLLLTSTATVLSFVKAFRLTTRNSADYLDNSVNYRIQG